MSSAARPVVRRDPPVNPPPALIPLPIEASPLVPQGTKSPHAILCSARARLAEPARWLHRDLEHHALDAPGTGCRAWDSAAVRWDLYGALCAARGKFVATEEALVFVARAIGVRTGLLPVVDWYDAPERSHGEVLRVLDTAVLAASAAYSGAIWAAVPT